MWFRQIAQLSTTMSQAQRATAFHCRLHKHDRLSYSAWTSIAHLLDFETLLASRVNSCVGFASLGLWRGIGHICVRHVFGSSFTGEAESNCGRVESDEKLLQMLVCVGLLEV